MEPIETLGKPDGNLLKPSGTLWSLLEPVET